MASSKIKNPKTGRMVKRSGATGKKILAERKNSRGSKRKNSRGSNKKNSKGSNRKPSRKSGKGFCTKRRSPKTCGSQPNCTWRKKSKTCVRQQGVRSGSVYEGPMRPRDYK
tara:strand:+ start:550 stop:882 length:333 start_codon:yes stop_codon:yes gene_type:complete